MPTRSLRNPDRVIDFAQAQIPLPASYRSEIPLELRQLAFTVSGIEEVSTVRSVLGSLNEALEDGQNFTQWKETVTLDALRDIGEARQQLIFRMHSQTAYNRGRVSYAQENGLDFLRYSATLDEQTRPSHLALDGTTLPVDDEFWETYTPPLGFNCRCVVSGISRATANRGGTRRSADDEAPTGRGRTPGQARAKIARTVSPDEGFSNGSSQALQSATNFYRRQSRELPESIREAFAQNLLLRQANADRYLSRNSELFEGINETN